MLQGGHGSFVAHGQQGRHGKGAGENIMIKFCVRSMSGPEGRVEAGSGTPAWAERTECRRSIYPYIRLSLPGVN